LITIPTNSKIHYIIDFVCLFFCLSIRYTGKKIVLLVNKNPSSKIEFVDLLLLLFTFPSYSCSGGDMMNE